MNSMYIKTVSILLISLIIAGIVIMANENPMDENRAAAPEFPAGAEWINTERPLTMRELRGRVVLLDFWTYCCINCMHVLPDLARLEEKFGDRLVVVGVHSAKFSGERDTGNIREAVKRYNIRHPVINDAGLTLWNQLGVRAWPTLVIIDPRGELVGKVSGEGNYDILDRAIADLLEGAPSSGEGLSALPIAPEADRQPETLLRYPGKLLADPERDRLYIADSGHNRLVVADLADGDVLYVVGSGEAGLQDGDFREASFSNPQGMALDGDQLYVADTDNHALRVVDLQARTVRTVAGTGQQASWGAKGGPANRTSLNSPWDVVILESKVYIAMAGPHQIWRYDPGNGEVEVFAGSGREDITDGPLKSAALAQPSGIATDGHAIYFADSETSSIRKAADGQVTTLIGKGLFIFGNQDGTFRTALLQHPLGVAWENGRLWVADTYNNRLRRINLTESTIVTVAGADEDGFVDGRAEDARFDEPGGVTLARDKVYIADTNNHAVRIYDPVTETVTTYNLVELVRLSPEADTFVVRVLPPEGYHINTDAPSSIEASVLGDERMLEHTQSIQAEELRASFPLRENREGAVYDFRGDLYLCREGEQGVCTIREFSFRRKLKYDPEVSFETNVEYRVSEPEVEPAVMKH